MPAYSNEGYETCEYLGTEEIAKVGTIDIYYCKDSTPHETMIGKINDDPKVANSIPVPNLLNGVPSGYPPITKVLKRYYQEKIATR